MNILWYKKPAKDWCEGLPMGNGFIGTMQYGGKLVDIISVNDCTLWSGYPKDGNRKESYENLDKIRKLIFEGKNVEANALVEEKCSGSYSESFMPLGDIIFEYQNISKRNYMRQLDISSAIHTVSCGNIKRESFVSNPDKVAVYRAVCEEKFDVTIAMVSQLKSEVYFDGALNLLGNAPDEVLIRGVKEAKYNENLGMAFCLRLDFKTNGDIEYKNNKVNICNATYLDCYFVTSTGFIGYDKFPITDRNSCKINCVTNLKKLNKNYEIIKQKHIEDYKNIYDRNSFSLNSKNQLPTDKLVKLAKRGKVENALVELFYNYGKYLTISASREGGQSMNLQGIWNNLLFPPWSSNYTVNINTEMNYWGTSSANMSECLFPFIEQVYQIMQSGKKTAEINYGCNGSVCNHNVDLWKKTSPSLGLACWLYSPMCGMWLANEVYQHYKYGQLMSYKEKIEEIVTENAKFINDYLILKDGFYVTCPSTSPEASFYIGNQKTAVDYASAFDMGVTKQLIINYLDFCNEGALADSLKAKLTKLYPIIKEDNVITEWHKYYKPVELGHRHFSPLYAFYPAKILKSSNIDEKKACLDFFNTRLENSKAHIGWSAAWGVCISARMRDGERAKKFIDGMLKKCVFKNLFDIHPVKIFQIDGNLGIVAGICEMLATSDGDQIELLGGIPSSWSSGKIVGLRVEGGAELDFEWFDGKLTKLNIKNGNINIKKTDKTKNTVITVE